MLVHIPAPCELLRALGTPGVVAAAGAGAALAGECLCDCERLHSVRHPEVLPEIKNAPKGVFDWLLVAVVNVGHA